MLSLKKLTIVVAFFALTLMQSGVAYAAEATGLVKTIDSDGKPVPNVPLIYCDVTDNTAYINHTLTDSNGIAFLQLKSLGDNVMISLAQENNGLWNSSETSNNMFLKNSLNGVQVIPPSVKKENNLELADVSTAENLYSGQVIFYIDKPVNFAKKEGIGDITVSCRIADYFPEDEKIFMSKNLYPNQVLERLNKEITRDVLQAVDDYFVTNHQGPGQDTIEISQNNTITVALRGTPKAIVTLKIVP